MDGRPTPLEHCRRRSERGNDDFGSIRCRTTSALGDLAVVSPRPACHAVLPYALDPEIEIQNIGAADSSHRRGKAGRGTLQFVCACPFDFRIRNAQDRGIVVGKTMTEIGSEFNQHLPPPGAHQPVGGFQPRLEHSPDHPREQPEPEHDPTTDEDSKPCAFAPRLNGADDSADRDCNCYEQRQ